MQHKHTLSDFKEKTGDGSFIYGFDSQPEEEDRPITIRSGVSMPVWKTPSVLQEHPADSSPRYSDGLRIDSGKIDSANVMSDFSDLEDPEETNPAVDLNHARAAILSEKPVKLSFWKRFTSFVARYIPSFSDESSLLRFNLYLGGAAFFIAIIILVVVLVTRPTL